jgi:hypothetical protein
MSRTPPPVAQWLLLWSGAPDALIGDLHEAYAARHSRLWYWREVVLALAIALRGSIFRNKVRAIRNALGGVGVLSAFAFTFAGRAAVDVATGVDVELLTSGWAEVETGQPQTKLVPVVVFRLRNLSSEPLPVLQVNAVFHRGNDDYEWDNAYRKVTGLAGLPPGSASDNVILRAGRGYTGSQRADALLTNSHFVDASVDISARYGSTSWVKLGEFPIDRLLLIH